MIAISALLAPLTRTDVSEIRLVSGKRPAMRLGGGARLEEMPGEAISADVLLRILFGAGGSRYVESLGPKPAQWRTRIEGVGAVVVNATQRGDAIEAWFALRDGPPGPSPRVTPPVAPRPTPPPPPRAAPRSPASAASFRALPPAAPTPRVDMELDDDGDRPSGLPTPPRGFEVPREALPSLLDFDVDIPSVPSGGRA